eukprot:TCONS_00009174-protein
MDSGEIVKLKKEHQKEIEKLKMEFKIQQLESENEKTLKIMQLEKEIQTLSHQFEMFKLKNSRESQSSQIQADQQLQKQKDELQNKLVEKEKQLLAKEHEMVLYKKEQEKETDAKENEWKMKMKDLKNEWKMKMKDLENEHKIKMLQTETKLSEMEKERIEKEATVQHLNREIENLKRVIQKQNQAADKVEENMTTIERLVWGAEYFHEGNKSSLLYPSYGDWYKVISAMMGNKEVFKKDKYLFMRKEFNKDYEYLDFVNRKDNSYVYKEESDDFLVEDLKIAWETATFFLLHTKDFGKHLKFGQKSQNACIEYCRVVNVSKDFHIGDKRSAIVFGILK